MLRQIAIADSTVCIPAFSQNSSHRFFHLKEVPSMDLLVQEWILETQTLILISDPRPTIQALLGPPTA